MMFNVSEIVGWLHKSLEPNGVEIQGAVIKSFGKIQIEIFNEGDKVIIDLVGVLPQISYQKNLGLIKPKITARLTKIELGPTGGKLIPEDFPFGYPFEYK